MTIRLDNPLITCPNFLMWRAYPSIRRHFVASHVSADDNVAIRTCAKFQKIYHTKHHDKAPLTAFFPKMALFVGRGAGTTTSLGQHSKWLPRCLRHFSACP